MKHFIPLLFLVLSSLSSFAQWQNDFLSQHNYTSKALKKSPKLKWSFLAKGAIYGPALKVKDNIAFYNTRASDLFAVNKNTEEHLWSFKSEGSTWGFAIVAEDIIYFGSGDDKLYAINLYTGEKHWEYKVNQPVHRPAIYNKTVYFPSGNTLYAIY